MEKLKEEAWTFMGVDDLITLNFLELNVGNLE